MINEPAALVSLRHAVFDHYQRWSPARPVAEPVHVVDIDDLSLSRLGQWPWPRTVIAELNQRLVRAGARVIGYDVLFAEPARADPGGDARFASSLGTAPAVLGFVLAQRGSERLPETLPSRVVLAQPGLLDAVHDFPAAQFPLPELGAVSALGAINFIPDADGVVRRVPLLLRLGDVAVPGLAGEMWRLAQGAGNFVVNSHELAGLSVGIGALRVPVSEQGEMWIRYGKPRADRYLPAWAVLDGSAELGALRDKLVLVGASANALMDLRFSPLGEVVPGVEVHAQVLEQFQARQWLVRPAQAMAIELLLTSVVGAIVMLFALRMPALSSALAAAVLLLALMWGGWYMFRVHGVLLDPATPALLGLPVFVVASLMRHMRAEHRQRWVREVFSRYVSPNLVKHLVTHPEAVELSGVRRVCSFVFTDLTGYTALMERNDPAAVVSMINEYIDGMVGIAFAHHGTLERVVGDGMMVMFSAPVVQPDHAARAVACALEMSVFAREFARKRNAAGVEWGQTRIGLHTGEVIVGNFGGSTIFSYSALGDPVNTASRLEGANKTLGTLICVSQDTLDECPQARSRPAGRLVLVGRSGVVAASELLPGIGVPGEPADAEYEAAYALLAAGDNAAQSAFECLAEKRAGDSLVELHLRRLRGGERGDLIVLSEK